MRYATIQVLDGTRGREIRAARQKAGLRTDDVARTLGMKVRDLFEVETGLRDFANEDAHAEALIAIARHAEARARAPTAPRAAEGGRRGGWR